MTHQPAIDWDPFEKQILAERQQVDPPQGRIPVPAWVSTLAIISAVAGFVVLFSTFFIGGETITFTGIIIIAISFGMAFGADALRKDMEWERWILYRVAHDNDWSFRLVRHENGKDGLNDPTRRRAVWQVKHSVTSVTADSNTADKLAQFADDVGGRERTYDPLIAEAYRKIGHLMAARPGQPIPIDVSALYRGRTKDGVPFWMGAQLAKTVMVAANKALKTDARGNADGHGHGIALVLAFPLSRDTGIVADLLAEALWDARKDIDTESTQFNDIFNIKLRSANHSEAELLRVLSPATQTAMIDLAARYKTQFVISDDTIFMAGYDLVNIENPEALAEIVAQVVDDFASAATSFKTYAE